MGFEPTWACAQRHLKPPLIPFSNGRQLPASYLAGRCGGTRTGLRCTGSWPPATPSAPCARNRMAVGAQQSQVLTSVVAPVAVDVVDLQGHGLPVPLGRSPARVAELGDADLTQGPAEQHAPGATPTIMADQDMRCILPRRRARLVPLMCLAEKMGRVHALFRDPATQHASLTLVVRPLKAPERLGHGLRLRHDPVQDSRIRSCALSGETRPAMEARLAHDCRPLARPRPCQSPSM